MSGAPSSGPPRRAGAAVAAAALAIGAVLAAFVLDPGVSPPRERDGAGARAVAGSGAAPGAAGEAPATGLDPRAARPPASTPADRDAAALFGVVLGPGEEPIAGARVRAARVRARPPEEREAVTDAGGFYALEGLAPGQWLVLAGGGRFRDRATRASLASGERARLDFALEPGGAVRGRVVDTRGGPLAGIEVVTGPRPRRTVATGADGAFEIGGAEPGDPHLMLEVRDPSGRHAPESRLAEVDGPPLEIVLAAAGRFVGRVTVAGSGAAVEGVAAVLDERPVPERLPLHIEARSGADGSLEVAGLRPGTYRVRVEKAGLSAAEAHFDVREGETVERDLVLGAGGAIAGRVTDAATGAPLEGATVWDATGEDTASALSAPDSLATVPGVRSTRTGADGTFRLGDTPLGKRDLIVAHPERLALARSLTVAAGAEVKADFALEAGGAIVGTVRGPGGAPAAAVAIGITPEDGPARRTVTDAAGTYALRGLRPGAYLLSLAAGRTRTVTLSAGETARADFGVGTGATVLGTVRRANRGGTREVYLVPAVADVGSFERTRVEADGTFRFEHVEPGMYDVALEPWIRRRITVGADEAEVTVDLELPAEQIRGRIVGDAGPVNGAQIAVSGAGGFSARTTSDPEGEFAFEGLEPDAEYELRTRAGGLGADVRIVRAGEASIEVRLSPSPGGSLRFRGLGPAGEDVGIRELHFEDARGQTFDFPAELRALISGLAPGTYSVTGFSRRFGLARRTGVEIRAGEETAVDLAFSADAGALEILAREVSGEPAAGAVLDLRFADGGRVPPASHWRFADTRTDSLGRVRRDGLPAGRYRGTLRTDDGRDGRTADFEVDIRAGETPHATVVVPARP